MTAQHNTIERKLYILNMQEKAKDEIDKGLFHTSVHTLQNLIIYIKSGY